MRRIIGRQKETAVDDPETAKLDSAFHTAIAESSKNRVLASFVFALHPVLREVLIQDITPEVGSAAVQQHIARGIIDGDEAAAGAAMEEHLGYLNRLQAWRKKRSAS